MYSRTHSSNPHHFLLTCLLALVALAIAQSLMLYATNGRVAYTMDSLSYRDAALNFVAGRSMQSTNVLAMSPEYQPFLLWPSGYPALWASVARLGNIPIDDVPSLLNPVLLGITTLTIFWIGCLVTGQPVIAFVVATVSAFVPSNMIVFGHAWSETAFIPLLLLAYAAFWKYRVSHKSLLWLTIAAICIGLANWIRYAGVVFYPIFFVSVLAFSVATPRIRLLHALGATLLSLALAFPLWLRNWQLSGNISGSSRSGVVPNDRLIQDASAILDLIEHSFFAFSMVLRANLEIPIIIAIVYILVTALRRQGVQRLMGVEIWLPVFWLTGYILFLLYARTIRADVPMDLRMLAVAFPFILLALLPTINAAFSDRSITLQKSLVILLLGLLVNSGCHEAYATRENYASAGVPRWRSKFFFSFRDLRNTSPTSHALLESIGPAQPTSLILTDYSARYIRYLTGARAYQPTNDKDCSRWSDGSTEGLLLIGSPDLPAWAADCLRTSTKWQLLLPTGRASPSIYAD